MKLNTNKIKAMMADKGLNGLRLAERTNLTRPTVYAILGGKSCSVESAGKIAKALGVKTSEIMEV